ncbi:MAG: hypothetical protein IJR45_02880, partial [Firmicutes bacterium]|nr:hypothetical protein [Bacillota bacterium]
MNRNVKLRIFCLLFIVIYLTGCSQSPVQPDTNEDTPSVSSAGGEEKIYGGSITLSMGFPETLNP